jgi:hypothetical protein
MKPINWKQLQNHANLCDKIRLNFYTLHKFFSPLKPMALVLLLLFATQTIKATTYYSIASGNWNSNTTWSLTDKGPAVASGIYPMVGDIVNIVRGYAVTITAYEACTTLNVGGVLVGQGNGTIIFNNGTQLTVAGNMFLGFNPMRTGTLNMTSGGTLKIGGTFTVSNGSYTFNPGSGEVDFNGGAQSVLAISPGYYNLTFSGVGTKVLEKGTLISGYLSINSSAIVNLTGTANTANALLLDGFQEVSGKWGSSSSAAMYVNNTYFSGTGYVSVATGCSSPLITGQPGNQSITYGADASFTVTATGNGLTFQWQEYITTWLDIIDDGVYSNTSTATLKITRPGVSLSGHKYRCFVTGTCGPNTIVSNGTARLTVSPKALTVTATGPAKVYGSPLSAGFSTTNFLADLTGVGTEAVTGVTLTPNAAGISGTTPAGSAYAVTPSSATGTGGFLTSNYNITYNSFNGIVSKKELTVIGAVANNKIYDGTNGTTISWVSLAGSVNGDDVAIDALTGTFAQADAGTNIPVSVNLTLKGATKDNYTFTEPVGLSADIIPKGIIIFPEPGQNKIEGDSDPIFTYTNSEWSDNSNISGALGRDPGETAGPYVYTLGTLSAGSNYSLALVPSPSTFTISTVTGIEEQQEKNGLTLQNYPNPFDAYTIISYQLPFDGKVTLTVRNIIGQIVKTIESGMETRGEYSLMIDDWGQQSGVYMATLKLKNNDKELSRTIKLVKAHN